MDYIVNLIDIGYLHFVVGIIILFNSKKIADRIFYSRMNLFEKMFKRKMNWSERDLEIHHYLLIFISLFFIFLFLLNFF